MKKIDKLILKSFLGPLLLTFTIAVFVLLMQFVWKYIDDLVGKGLEIGIIAELLLYASATFVPMALPIAVLFASIMTMGNFGEKYELVAMKAGGISVRRIMMPMALVALLLTGIAFYFANNVLPMAMYKYRITLYDIQRKKPAVSIRPSEYYTEIDGYVIRVNSKAPDGRTMRDIIIYDHTQGINNTNIIVADHGYMQTTPDDHYLLFTLFKGYTYNEQTDGENALSRPLTKTTSTPKCASMPTTTQNPKTAPPTWTSHNEWPTPTAPHATKYSTRPAPTPTMPKTTFKCTLPSSTPTKNISIDTI